MRFETFAPIFAFAFFMTMILLTTSMNVWQALFWSGIGTLIGVNRDWKPFL